MNENPYISTRATLTIFSEYLPFPFVSHLTLFTALSAFLLLFSTFAVGLRCFADFDRGLKESKTDGQSYTPMRTKPDLFGD
jgi:hypothetical protein